MLSKIYDLQPNMHVNLFINCKQTILLINKYYLYEDDNQILLNADYKKEKL